jgi:hypothetical protein
LDSTWTASINHECDLSGRSEVGEQRFGVFQVGGSADVVTRSPVRPLRMHIGKTKMSLRSSRFEHASVLMRYWTYGQARFVLGHSMVGIGPVSTNAIFIEGFKKGL